MITVKICIPVWRLEGIKLILLATPNLFLAVKIGGALEPANELSLRISELTLNKSQNKGS
jgi:hypothetical protein